MKTEFTKEDIRIWLETDCYPTTVISDRYSGTYSGGLYTAFPLFYYELPGIDEENPDGDDVDCMMFWEHIKIPYGVGADASSAVDDLVEKMRAKLIELNNVNN